VHISPRLIYGKIIERERERKHCGNKKMRESAKKERANRANLNAIIWTRERERGRQRRK